MGYIARPVDNGGGGGGVSRTAKVISEHLISCKINIITDRAHTVRAQKGKGESRLRTSHHMLDRRLKKSQSCSLSEVALRAPT